MKLRGGLLGVNRAKDARYPLTEILSNVFPLSPTSKPGGKRKKVAGEDSGVYSVKRDARIEVVSEKLCGMPTMLSEARSGRVS